MPRKGRVQVGFRGRWPRNSLFSIRSLCFSQCQFHPPHWRLIFSRSLEIWPYSPQAHTFLSSPLQRKRLAFLGFNCKNTEKRLICPVWATCPWVQWKQDSDWQPLCKPPVGDEWEAGSQRGAGSVAITTGEWPGARRLPQFVSTTLWYACCVLSPECDRELTQKQ